MELHPEHKKLQECLASIMKAMHTVPHGSEIKEKIAKLILEKVDPEAPVKSFINEDTPKETNLRNWG